MSGRSTVSALLLCLAVVPDAAAVEPPPATWPEVQVALERFPPAFESSERRFTILQGVDALLNEPLSGYRPDLVAFYRGCVDRALDGLEKTPVTEGVRVWKLYSSSILLKSRDGVVALDFCQGPIQNGGEPERAAEADTQFYWTPAQRERLARLVDVMLITHRHHDHADYSLAAAMVRRQRPVLAPEQVRAHWSKESFAAALTVPEYETPQRFGPCEAFAGRGLQYALQPGQTVEDADPADPRHSEHAVFLVRTGGITFLQAGDNWQPLDGWLERARRKGWQPDVVFAGGMHASGESVQRAYPGAFRIPVHDHELKHAGGGNKLASSFARDGVRARRGMVLMWGESFDITRGILSP